MAILHVLKYPDPRLRKVAKPVADVNDEIRKIIDDLLETMYEDNGVGLAATQANIQKRIIVMDVSAKSDEPFVLINPEIMHAEGTVMSEEGCLSVPGIYEKVKRAKTITAKDNPPKI